MIKYVIFLLLLLCNSCKSNKEIFGFEKEVSIDYYLDFYLENRVNSCVQAIKYMDYHIIPDSSNLFMQSDSKHYALINAKVPGEFNNHNDNKLINFYISEKCLRSISSEELLSIFLVKDDLEEMFKLLRNPKNRLGVDIVIENIGGFSAAFVSSEIVELNLMQSQNK